MARFIKNRYETFGKIQGSLVFIGTKKVEKTTAKIISYNQDNLIEKEIENFDDINLFKNEQNVNWINIYGIHDVEAIRKIGEIFGLNNLFLEDILNTDHQPKYENNEDFESFILKIFNIDTEKNEADVEQITIILSKNYVLTIQEESKNYFEPVRERIRNKNGKIRQKGNDYLVISLLDIIFDKYMYLTEYFGQKIEENEALMFTNYKGNIAENVYNLKTEISFIRKNIRPVKDFVNRIFKYEHTFFRKANFPNLNDLDDTIESTNDTIELYYNLLSDQLNTYNTIVSMRTNKAMKVLTAFASIFIPLTFFAGIYGMNFDYLPELHLKYGYLYFWIVTILVGVGLLMIFKKKKWL